MLSWGKASPFCNMLIERLLSLIKRACPADCNSSSPELENLLGLGFVTQILTDHVTHGGDDPRASRRHEFLKQGVPLEAQRPPRRATNRKRPDRVCCLIYINGGVAKEVTRRANVGEPRMTRVEVNALKRSLGKQWNEPRGVLPRDRLRIAAVATEKKLASTAVSAAGGAECAERTHAKTPSGLWELNEGAKPVALSASKESLCKLLPSAAPSHANSMQDSFLPGINPAAEMLRTDFKKKQ